MKYRISTVSEMTGVARNTLIAWERRYGFVRPERHSNGYRSYDEQDVARIIRVKNAVSAGLKISEAVSLLRESEAQDGRQVVLEQDGQALREGGSFATIREKLTAALVHYRRTEVDQIWGQLLTIPFATRLKEVYFPVLRRVGEMWEAGEISVAEEHFASGLIRSHFAALLVSSGTPSRAAPSCICTTVPGEQHEIVALALAVQLSMAGYRVTYLGANMPQVELSAYCKNQGPDLVCVSCLQIPNQEELVTYAKALRCACKKEARIVIGGACLEQLALDVSGVEFVPHWEDLSY